jgi:hypothetical protein
MTALSSLFSSSGTARSKVAIKGYEPWLRSTVSSRNDRIVFIVFIVWSGEIDVLIKDYKPSLP